jgi:hypothetical protein
MWEGEVRLAVFTTFKANKKEPVGDLLVRVYAAFLEAGPAPQLQFVLADAPIAGFTSSVDRVLKRYPAMSRYLTDQPVLPGNNPVRQLTSRASNEPVAFETLQTIAAGIPKSFPFHSAQFGLARADFGVAGGGLGSAVPGVAISDGWWVNGRIRSLSATVVLEPEIDDRALPELAESVNAILAVCGKVDNRVQVPLADTPPANGVGFVPLARPEVVPSLGPLVAKYREQMDAVMARANLPNELPPADMSMRSFADTTGPRKPVLTEVFKPMGYDCKAGSGTYELRRRTASNLTVEVSLDVGTWSKSLTAMYSVQGLGFGATLPLPPGRGIRNRQYPLGDAAQWRKLVENLGALVAELDRSFVPEVEAAVGETPAWYKPEG